MKINGETIDTPYSKTLVIPREIDSKSVTFVFRAVRDTEMEKMEEFNPEPKVPWRIPEGATEKEDNPKDPEYLKKLKDHSERNFAIRFILSISATEGLEWGGVKLDDATTWTSFEKELAAAGFNSGEINEMMKTCCEVNGLITSHIDDATKAFLASLQETPKI